MEKQMSAAELIKQRKSRTLRSNLITYAIVIVFYAVVQAMVNTGHISSLMKGLLVPICVYVIAAVSLNLVVGISGELSIGHAGFMSVGAFSGILCADLLEGAVASDPVRLTCAIIAGGIVAGIAGILIGVIGLLVFRASGSYIGAFVAVDFITVLAQGLIRALFLFLIVEQLFWRNRREDRRILKKGLLLAFLFCE